MGFENIIDFLDYIWLSIYIVIKLFFILCIQIWSALNLQISRKQKRSQRVLSE